MKFLFPPALLALTLSVACGEELSEADRETILQRLEAIQDASNARVDQKFRSAMSALSAASGSESAALNLYLDCVKLVNFDKEDKSHVEFREWQRKNKEKYSEASFKLALKYQLQWLILVIKAASEDPDMDQIANDAAGLLGSIIARADDLNGQRATLQQGVNSSVFAKAYEINDIRVEELPMAPLQIDAIYEQLLLPPLRDPDRINSLRSAWQKRIAQKGELIRQWSVKPDEHLRQGERPPEYEKFIEEQVPQLRWAMEVDVFNAGDERGAAIAMLQHIEKHLAHQSATQWAEQFTSLLMGEPLEGEAEKGAGEKDTKAPE